MTDQMTRESREWLEAECLRSAKKVPGCEHLTQVRIRRSEKGTGNWRVEKFIPNLPPNLKTAARSAIVKEVASKHLLMGE